MKKRRNIKNKTNKPLFVVILLSFLIIILLSIYIIYLRFIPYKTIEYDGYAVSGKEIASNLLNTNFDVDHNVKALQVKDQDSIYENLNSYYLGASKQDNINLNYPIYVNNSLALYNLSPKVTLITDEFQEVQGYSGTTLTSGELYNSNTLQRADYYDYILLKNTDNLYINTKEFKVKTNLNEYTIKMNSIINFTREFITFYTLKNDEFVYDKILDVDESSTITIEDYKRTYTYKEFLMNLGIIREETNNNQEQNNTTENETKECVIAASSKTVERGNEFSIIVDIKNNPGIWGLKFKVSYDHTALTLTSVKNGTVFDNEDTVLPSTLDKEEFVYLAYLNSLKNNTGNGTIVTLNFTVNEAAEFKPYIIGVNVTQAINVDSEDITLKANDGAVSVVKCIHVNDTKWDFDADTHWHNCVYEDCKEKIVKT